ncbi:MAG: NAD(P)H-hydrate epimerase, partial [Nitriliruptoraceae bacterium]|nr:NAD(P)H-hydrate epimerase [Nitriliruptoraceae bacterium]
MPAAAAGVGGDAVPLLDAAAARAGDEAAVAAGDSWAGLMARAAGHLARHTVRFAGRGAGLKVAVVVGKGNNGGDGWAAARLLERRYGAQAWVIAVHGLQVELSAEAAAERAAWRRTRGRTSAGTDALEPALRWCDVAIDAVLGTGIRGEVRDEAAIATRALRAAHDAGTPVVACDVPSGVSSDDGQAARDAVVADLTVTFGARKRGLVLHPGAAHAGRVAVASLGPGTDAWVRSPAATQASDTGRGPWMALTARGAAPTPLAVDA